MANTGKFQLHSDVLLTNVEDEMVLLDMKNGQYYGLNAIGCEVLNLINKGKTLKQVELEISRRYKIDKQTVHNDIGELITDLKKQNLLLEQ